MFPHFSAGASDPGGPSRQKHPVKEKHLPGGIELAAMFKGGCGRSHNQHIHDW
jgi:hypothetical protein